MSWIRKHRPRFAHLPNGPGRVRLILVVVRALGGLSPAMIDELQGPLVYSYSNPGFEMTRCGHLSLSPAEFANCIRRGRAMVLDFDVLALKYFVVY